jgi:DHA2 family methylenomycin A resistance protein-like MFS transporter
VTPISSSRPTSPRLALLVIAVVFVILNADITTVNVALVTVGKDLHSDLEDLQWGLNSYMLAFAALIVAAGRLADVFGHRCCLLAGSLLFAIASLICGIAPTLSVLVMGRVLQGAGAALMLPAGMAIVSAVYSGEERAVALGTLVGVGGVAQSIGPLVGGFLTAEVSWRFVFLINLPLIAVIMIVALRGIETRSLPSSLAATTAAKCQSGSDPSMSLSPNAPFPRPRDEIVTRRIDIAGVAILAVALTSLLIGLDLTGGSDRNPRLALGLIVLSLVLFGVFTIVERQTSNAIVDGKLLRIPPFLCSCVASCLLGFVFFLFLFIAAVYLQEELGYSALTAGIALAPFSLVLAVTGVMAGRLTSQFPLTSLLIASCVSMALGLAILSFVASYGYLGMLFPCLLIAAGAGPGFTLLNTAGLAAVPSERSGQATGIIYMFRFGGGAIGVAVASTLHGVFFHSQLVARLSETPLSVAQQKVLEQPGAIERLRQLESGLVGSQIEQVRLAFHESFAAAFANTLRLNVILPIVIMVLVMMLIQKRSTT